MKRLVDILNKPYPYYIPITSSIKLLVILSAVIPLFLLVFQPFGLDDWICEYKIEILIGMILPIFVTLLFNFNVGPILLPGHFNEGSWTILKEIMWSIWNFVTLVLSTSYYWTIVPECSLSYIHWGEQLARAFLIGILPGLLCIYFNYSRALKRKLVQAERLNERLKAVLAFHEDGYEKIIAENGSDTIIVPLDRLLFIKSCDNYCEIYSATNDEMKSELIRASLKSIVPQIKNPYVVRCHRSYIVNLSKIQHVQGTARDFKLVLSNSKELIPVSREAYRRITKLLDEASIMTDAVISYTSYKSE